mmetsp:Transcript_6129/g.7413  ORF Transcript_6129/g.7413 Transcript_6129/m.7413 type:complete len:564 (+) Transcript_6129:936-2627(+)
MSKSDVIEKISSAKQCLKSGSSLNIKKPKDPLKHVIHPDTKFSKWWHGIILALIFITSFTTPFAVGIMPGLRGLPENPLHGFLFFGFVVSLIFWVDTFMNFFKAYRNPRGILVFDLKKIRRHYLRGWFLVDALGCVPADLIVLLASNDGEDLNFLKVFELFRLFRISRATRIINNSDTFIDFSLRTPSYVRQLTYYIFLLIIINHWLACSWSLIVFLETGSFEFDSLANNSNWLFKYVSTAETALEPIGYEVSNIFDRYILCLYWSIMTVTSIGYGDVTPDAPAEYWMCTFMMLFGGITWAYIIGATVSIASTLNGERDAFEEKLGRLNLVIRETPNLNSDKELKFRLRRYLYTRQTRGYGAEEVRNATENDLPDDLRDLIRSRAFEPYIEKVRILRRSMLGENKNVPALKVLFEGVKAQSYAFMTSFILDDKENKDEIETRGIRCVKTGLVAVRKGGGQSTRVLTDFGCFGVDTVFLSERSSLLNTRYCCAFVYSEIYFFPRSSVIKAAELCPRLWKYARWKVALLQILKVAKELNSKRHSFKNKFKTDDAITDELRIGVQE